MAYKCTNRQDYSHFASGRVFYSHPGMAAFPIRLMDEVFSYCTRELKVDSSLTLYDPVCGSGYHLSALALLHPCAISAIFASDIDARCVSLAKQNIGLLRAQGISHRRNEIQTLYNSYGKKSHFQALQSVAFFEQIIHQSQTSPATVVFRHDILHPNIPQPLLKTQVQLIFADIPYGSLTSWSTHAAVDERWTLLENSTDILQPLGLIAISQIEKQTIKHEAYRQIHKIKIGKRVVRIFRLEG